ncbi:GGDEF-domain containing protein [Psychromonas sp. psych-6C06]|uniref:putative bifunctional diguanylate cyclase/phosphodiesterase n=1 Tax=Psychromonas sp. psych-6C06 TaxID=2058089 RepID=UPI000C324AF3|nr:bifunctional diguanylate cyclase/phosphodiesterase [Psychromonas sp. psych-6C06]PKF61801.1 GGDEF-domain containing protein [Psychromonas sp. psych-6C06]
MDVRKITQRIILPAIFLFLFTVVFYTYISLHHTPSALTLYGVAATLLATAYFSKQLKLPNNYKYYACLVSFLLLLASGFIFVSDIEEIEEMYIFIPFLYLLILPGSMWPILISFLLLSAYYPSIETNSLSDVIEDGLELVVIATFATIMTYFQQHSLQKMRLFRQESYIDELTRLSNRKSINKKMRQLQKKKSPFALIILDLDGFKNINDQLGHLAGDEVLCQVSERLQKIDKVYRLWGDEFAYLITNEQDLLGPKVDLLTNTINDQMKPPFILNNKKCFLSACVGIATFPDDNNNIETLCNYADLAMYQSKSMGNGVSTYFDKSFIETIARRNQLERDLKRALEKKQLQLLYQPKMKIENNSITSAEALLRWEHPQYGVISPLEFIPIAEKSGEIIPIGYWVIEEVCQQITNWQKRYSLCNVAVNVSSIQLTANNFKQTVKAILEKTECQPKWLEIEQTESWLMDNQDNNINILSQLKNLGVSLALDDFGTGYSSLSQVARLPLDVLKIDKSFIDNCVDNEDDHMVVRTIIQLGKNLGMKIVAEGIEYESQRQLLKSEHCDYYQGYLFSKPVTAEELESLLDKQL